MTEMRFAVTSTTPTRSRRIRTRAHLHFANHESRITSHDLSVTNHSFLSDILAIRNTPNPFESNGATISNRHRSGPSAGPFFSPLTCRHSLLTNHRALSAIHRLLLDTRCRVNFTVSHSKQTIVTHITRHKNTRVAATGFFNPRRHFSFGAINMERRFRHES
jgi:hypothetical protein